MSARPNRPLKVLTELFNKALDENDFDQMDAIEKELDRVVYTRLRRIEYGGNGTEELENLLSQLPTDYNGKAVNQLFNKLDNRTSHHNTVYK